MQLLTVHSYPELDADCPCGSGLPYRDCHALLEQEKLAVTRSGTADLPWPPHFKSNGKSALIGKLQVCEPAFTVEDVGSALRFSSQQEWPSLIQCGVVATGGARYTKLFDHMVGDAEELASDARLSVQMLERIEREIDGFKKSKLDLTNAPYDWVRLSHACLDWSGWIVPARTYATWNPMFDWFLSHVPGGQVQAVRISKLRPYLRMAMNIMTRLHLIPANGEISSADLIFSGRTPFLSTLGVAIPMTLSFDTVWGFASTYQKHGFIFTLPEPHPLENMSHRMNTLFSVVEHWASGTNPGIAGPRKLVFNATQHRQFLVWYLTRIRAIESLLLNPLTFAKNGAPSFDLQRRTVTTWEMTCSFIEHMLASTEPEIRVQGALLVLDKLPWLFSGIDSIPALFSADVRRSVIKALSKLPPQLRKVVKQWAIAGWEQLDEQTESRTLKRARKPWQTLTVENVDVRYYEDTGAYVDLLRNLIHGYMGMYQEKAKEWDTRLEAAPTALPDVVLTIFLALLADPEARIHSVRTRSIYRKN